MDNVALHVQRLQLGGVTPRQRRRSRPSNASDASRNDAHACMRRMLTRGFRSSDSSTYLHQSSSTGCATPVFQVAFASRSQLLASVDEDGFVSLVDTSRSPDADATAHRGCSVFQRVHRKWQAHDNAVFDLCWTRGDAQVLTASGDLRVCAWDVETQQRRVTFEKGHTMSVKCVRQSCTSDDIIATGSRDGSVLLWDARAPAAPVAQLPGVHSTSAASQSPFKQSTRSPAGSASASVSSSSFVSPNGSRKRRKIAVNTPTSSTPRSVTGVEFLSSGLEIITSGAVDGTIKFWDVRRLMEPRKIPLASRSCVTSSSLPVRTLSCASRTGAQRGITSLALDATRSRLLASVSNDDLCVFDVGGRLSEPLLRLDGHIASSFYVKSTFSPDGDLVASGSVNGAVFVWDVRPAQSSTSPRSPLVVLKGHDSEVNGVAWHASDFTRLATAGDDGTVRVWSATRDTSAVSDDEPVAADAFQLKRENHKWTNWSELERQQDGRAYVVQANGQEEEKEHHMASTAPATSPPVIHRNRMPLSATRTPAAPASGRTPPRKQTLLDLWGR